MSRKAVKILFRVLGYILVAALLATVWIFASKPADMDKGTQQTEIRFTAEKGPAGEQVVGENARYRLSADLASHFLAVTDKQTGYRFTSAPEDMEEQEGMKNAAKMSLSSLLHIQFADRDSNITSVNSVAGALKRGNAAAEKIENGVRFTYYFEQQQMVVPLEVVLTDKGLQASVVLDDIQEGNPALKLTTVSVLPGFGAKAEGTSGYMLVPDGSGALIPYKPCDTKYAQRIYGRDPAVTAKTDAGFTEQTARLPVFGFTDGSHSCLGIIGDGDTRAWLKADPPTKKSPYGAVYPQFVFREKILVEVSQQTFESTQANMFEPNRCSLERFSVEYRFPEGKDYVAMANTYRQYLQETTGLEPLTDSRGALQLQLVGGILHTENFLGMPVSNVLPVTTYADAVELVNRLHEQGVEQVDVDFLHWYKDGTKRRLTLGMDTESRLGKKKDFEAMVQALSRNGQVYMDLNFAELYGSHSGFSSRYDSARTVLLEPLAMKRYMLSTHQVNELADPLYLLKGTEIQKAADRFLKDSRPEGCRFSLNGMAGTIYSDFGKDGQDRGAMRQVFTSVMDEVTRESGKMLFYAPNAYAFPYARTIQGVPTGHSGFLCETEAVPFYAFALHGLVPMSCEAVNVTASRETVLRAAESGIGLTYVLGAQNTNAFKDNASAGYYYLDAAGWLPRAAEDYRASEALIREVEHKAVVSHEAVADGVYKTVFDGGAGVLVNYTGRAAAINGVTVEAQSFTVIHE